MFGENNLFLPQAENRPVDDVELIDPDIFDEYRGLAADYELESLMGLVGQEHHLAAPMNPQLSVQSLGGELIECVVAIANANNQIRQLEKQREAEIERIERNGARVRGPAKARRAKLIAHRVTLNKISKVQEMWLIVDKNDAAEQVVRAVGQ